MQHRSKLPFFFLGLAAVLAIAALVMLMLQWGVKPEPPPIGGKQVEATPPPPPPVIETLDEPVVPQDPEEVLKDLGIGVAAVDPDDLVNQIAKALEAGRFREDLYFRLAVVACKLPPLRERGDDIILLAKDFLKRFGTQNGREGLAFSPQAIQAILSHPWSGNVRELQNRIQRAVIMADAQWITEADLELETAIPAATSSTNSDDSIPNGAGRPAWMLPSSGLKEAREQLEREMVAMAIERHAGNVSAAAKELGISRPTLYELISRLGIAKE